MLSSRNIRKATNDDLAGIANLHARVFGPGRFTRSAYRVREGAPNLSTFDHVGLQDDKIIAAINFTQITIGETPGALLLGPFVVDPDASNKGLGAQLMEQGLLCAKQAGVKLVILVGDEPYYKRFGFKHVEPGQILFPGPVDPNRILATENVEDALQAFHGRVAAA